MAGAGWWPEAALVDRALPNLRNVRAGNVAEVLFGEVHLAQVMPVGPLGDGGRLAEGTLNSPVPARGARRVRSLVDRPGEGEDGPGVRHRAAGG